MKRLRLWSVSSLLALGVIAFSHPGGAQTGTLAWTQLQPTGTPPAPRVDASAVYVPATNQVILFGGNPSGRKSARSFDDTWVLSGANGLSGTSSWTQLSLTTCAPPPGRRGHSALYSPASDRMIVFGGDTFGMSAQKFNDVWILEHASGAGGTPRWMLLQPQGIPPAARSEHVAFYDQAHNRMVIFGGDGTQAANLMDLWVLTHADGTGGQPEWEELNVSGRTPNFSAYASATYDPNTNRLTIFGGWKCCSGPATNQVWVLGHANGLGGTPRWARLTVSGVSPTPRAGAQGKYNLPQNTAVYFGGTANNDLWQLSHPNHVGQSVWTQLTPQGSSPSARGGVVANAASSYDSANDRFIIFGGKGPTGILNDTWVLGASSVTASGNIYVVDTDNSRVQIFDGTAVYLSQFDHSFDLPTDITLDPNKNVYVKDGNLNCHVDKFDSTGTWLLSFGGCSTSGIGPGIFDNTGSVVSDAAGNVWVTSPDFYYMQKFDGGGNFLAIVCMADVGVPNCPQTTPFLVQPQGVEIDAAGNIYVSNAYPFTNGFNIVKFDAAGNYLSNFGSSGSGNGQLQDPEGMAFDADGNIYVADAGNNRIQKFDANGNYLSQFGSLGSGNGQFQAPLAIAFDANQQIYVTDDGNNRVQVFDMNGNYLSQFGSQGTGNGQFNTPYGIAIVK